MLYSLDKLGHVSCDADWPADGWGRKRKEKEQVRFSILHSPNSDRLQSKLDSSEGLEQRLTGVEESQVAGKILSRAFPSAHHPMQKVRTDAGQGS